MKSGYFHHAHFLCSERINTKIILAAVAGIIAMLSNQSMAQTATWTGGNTYNFYGTAGNWNPAGIPVGPTYTVIIPDASSVSYNLGSNGVVDAVSLGAGSVFRNTNNFGFSVNGPAVIKGQVEVGGAGSTFWAPANITALQVNPRLYATNGGQILVGASTYTWDRYNAAATLLSSIGANSLLDLRAVSSMQVSYGDSGSWTYAINARSNGVIDLSGVSQITGPGQDDWLEFNVDTGGALKLDSLRRISGQMRFDIEVPNMQFPMLENASTAHFNLGSNSSVVLPGLLSFSSANISLGQGASFTATNLNSISSANIGVGPGGLFRAPNLNSMDSVPLNLTNDATFSATNLATYKNSAIPILPGRNFQSGLLTNVDGSRISVSGGSTFRLGAPAYAAPSDWRSSYGLLTASGDGSVLTATNLTSMQVEGGWGGAWSYNVTAESNAVVDLSNLQTAIGANPSNWDNDDWLAFNVRNNGVLKLDSLRQVSRKVQFNIGLTSYDLPALESGDYAQFNLPDGARLNLPSLTRLNASSITFGFNSTFNAPKLRNLTDMDLSLGVGKIMIVPPITNIYASRLSVSGGSQLHIAAPDYTVPQDWRWSPTLFSADGAGSLLDLASMRSFQVYGGHGGGWVYRVTVNNSGVIDFSGLTSIVGCDPSNWGNDDWLEFNVRNGGSLMLNSLRQISRRARFNIEVPEFSMPSLESVDNTTFNLANGARLNLPNVTRLDNVTINYGLGSTLYAPNLLNLLNADLTVGQGRTVIVPSFTNVNGARISVNSGSNLVVAATAYEAPADWRASPNLFLSDGAGSKLNLSSMRSIRVYGGGSGGWRYYVTANNGGELDLSGLQTAVGENPGDYDNDDWLVFNVQGEGKLRLDSLTNVSGHVEFNVGDNSRLSAPSLTRVQNSTITLGFNSTMDASNLVEYIDSTLSLSPGKNLYGTALTNITSSRFSVSGGSSLRIPALTYDMFNDWRSSFALFTCDGAGSVIDLSNMKNFRATGGHSGTWYYSVNANNGGLINLSALDNISGADPSNWGNEDWLTFNANGAGVIRFGNASVTRKVQFNASAGDSRLEFASFYLRPPSTININNRATLNVKGNFAFENTDPNNIQVSAMVQMDGTQPQTLEVGGKDLGPTGASALNFGYSQLIIGNSNQASIVKLQDVINNGQRGSSGQSEALYLYGLDGQGLRLLNNSKIILNNVPVYALMGGQMRLLNSLVSPAANSLAFDNGILANTAGPKIIALSPSAPVTPPISSVDVTFDIPIKASTFTVADVTITGPNGTIPASSIVLVSGNTYRINFAPQGTTGNYTIKVGPAINEAAENLLGMDQDGDGVGGESVDDAFVGGFRVDGLPPVVVSAFGLQNGTRIGVTFDEPINPAFATNPANYTVNGLNPTNAVLQSNGYQVALWINPIVGDSFVLNVNNMVDLLGNVTNRSFAGTMLAMDARDIGSPGSNPREAGSTLTFNGTDFEMVAGGSDYFWNTSDAGHFASELRPGDFDVRVQVARINRADTYSQFGIMWRESSAANSRRIYACLTDPASGNNYYALIRYNPGEAGGQFPGNPQPSVGSLPAWVRLQRSGSTFIAYRGTDGTNWTEYGRVTVDFPTSGLLGMASDARNNNVGAVATVSYRDYGDISPSIVSQPQSQTVASGSNVVFGVSARGLPVLAYQWLFNGMPINNATNALLTLNAVTTGSVGDYRVVVTNNYGSVTSQVAALVVDGIGGGGFEADVAPTPYGNNTVTVSDWTRIGRLVAGLDTPLSSSEFMRADCAPRTNAVLGTLPLGDGRLTVADWAQAGRYAAGLDTLTSAGGPNQQSAGSPQFLRMANFAAIDGRTLRLVDTKAVVGQTFEMSIALDSLGDENALGFSLSFDPAKLAYVSASAPEGALQVNALQSAQGRVGIALAKSAGQSFPAGASTVVLVKFTALVSGTATINLGDAPVVREVANITAEPQQMVYQAGSVTALLPGSLSYPAKNKDGAIELQFTGQQGLSYRIEVSNDLSTWNLLSVQTADTQPITVIDANAGKSPHRFYRAIPQ